MMARQMMRSAAIALALGVAACGEGEVVEPEGDDSRIASGEVLEGSISDVMIPLDELRSQAPPLRTAPSGQGEGAATVAQDAAPDVEVPAEAAPVIEAEPVLDLAEPATSPAAAE